MHQLQMKGKTVSDAANALKNRLIKNKKKLDTYIKKNGLEAYRLYFKDIPEYPFLIDIYGTHAVIYEQGKNLQDEEMHLKEKHQKEVQEALVDGLKLKPELLHFKIRSRQKGQEQYQTLVQQNPQDYFPVSEPPFKFLVNLERYLDTGLFLDHRPLRQHLYKECAGKEVLNLFCYTGSLSVAAAKAGATVTSVDMSNTYLDWAYENFKLNELDPKKHVFCQADVLKNVPERAEKGEKFDIIILDPPSFSNSKRMEEDLDIERDHALLIRDCMKLLHLDGTLYFSTNKRKFELHDLVTGKYQVKEISQWTIPQDFHGSNIHRSFQITHSKN